jgi:transcriptional regulator with XRE-family HTH domain
MTQAPLPGNVPQWTLADRLRKAREHADLDQSDFADQVGISRRSVTNYEKGHSSPSRPVLLAWAMRTGVAMEWLSKGTTHGGPDGGEGLPRLDSNQPPSDYMSHSTPSDLMDHAERRRNARGSRRLNPFRRNEYQPSQYPIAV